MKRRLPFFILLFLCFSCTTSSSGDESKDSHEYPTSEAIEEAIIEVGEESFSCDGMDGYSSSYDELIRDIYQHRFRIEERQNTSRSSWIRSAAYYSCDGRYGYLIITTDRSDYVHADIPYDVWIGFKSADSFGRYYNSYIKGRY